jgi:hypothetical protein
MSNSLFPQHPFGLSSLLGLSVVEIPDRYEPVLQLRESVPVSDGFRRDFNAYLLETFGMRDISLVPKGTSFIFGGTHLMMRASDAVKLSSLI